MDDGISSDDDIQDSSISPKISGKKLKLNDGSSQNSLKEPVDSSSRSNENVDSGISADKSESTSSEDRTNNAAAGPSNEIIVPTPSGSSVREILLNIRRPRRDRNYRKRKTPGRDSDTESNDSSSRDSDDLSAEVTLEMRPDSEYESEDLQRLSAPSSATGVSRSSFSSISVDTNDSDLLVQLPSGDTDSDDDDPFSRSLENAETENTGDPPPVLLKPKPKHNYLMLREIVHREMGLSLPCSKATDSDLNFEQKFYGSLHAVYRLENVFQLNQHRGCVNAINFHPSGHLLVSGSDDTNVIVWDWARKKSLQIIRTGHKSNVFQSKFLHLNAQSQLNIVTCARDGQVRLVQCPAGGGPCVSRRRLGAHSRAAHKLHVSALEPHLVTSAGEDGLIMQCDVRAERSNKLFHVKNENGTIVPLYSVCGHPMEPRELLVGGRDRFVRVYDRRKATKPVATYCPAFLEDQEVGIKKKRHHCLLHLTSAVYNHDGSEILGSYNDEDIYLFNAKTDVYDKNNSTELHEGYQRKFSGHRNSDTYKGVSFFGPKSEYVVSGSDCSYIYMWDKETGAIVQWLKGDTGVVNCIEPHPRFPVMATSGLDKDVKIWLPVNDHDPEYKGMENVVRKNCSNKSLSPLFSNFLPTLYNAWRDASDADLDANACVAF